MPTRKYGLDAQVTFQYDQTETITLPAEHEDHRAAERGAAANKVSQIASSCTKKDATTITCQRDVPAQEPSHRSDAVQVAAQRRSRRSRRSRVSP